MPTNESTADVVRIISVRRSNKHERHLYLAYNDIYQ